MRVPDKHLAEIWDQGYTLMEGFLDRETLAEAQGALWDVFPKPEDYFADPSQHPRYAKSQFAGVKLFPYPAWPLNRIAVYPDLIDAAERFLEAEDIEIYKVELWGKYAGAINYDQMHRRDYGTHTLLMPS